MSRPLLHELVAAVDSGNAPARWRDAGLRIGQERKAVEALLSGNSDLSVYGFNTLLGPLDHFRGDDVGFERVIDAHLVGRPEVVSDVCARMMHSAKIIQLTMGGSGISREAYGALLAAFGSAGPVRVDFHASYGSGDVVPAAWWVQSILPSEALRFGDYIALINGSFVGAAMAALATVRLERAFASFFALYGAIADLEPATIGNLAEANFASELLRGARAPRGAIQRPVSLRDAAATALPLLRAVDVLEDSLEDRLRSPSANSRFVTKDGSWIPVSNSSFLSFDLSFALDSTTSAVQLVSGLLQRVTEWVCQERSSRSAGIEMALIQPPKVSQALHLEMAGLGRPSVYVGSMSGGVEDLWDGVLSRSLSLLRRVDLLDRQVEIANSVMEGPVSDSGTRSKLAERWELIGMASAL